MKRYSAREVDVETQAGALRVGLWSDRWVLAWRRDGAESGDEVFDVFADDAEALVPPLREFEVREEEARQLAAELIAERTMMDREGVPG